jgi:putative redox protein
LEREVSASWAPGPLQCDVSVDPGFDIHVDEPVSAGGTGSGPQPTDLLLASVASCFTLALVHSASKLGVTADGIDVTVTGTYDGPRFSDVRIDIRLRGVDPDAQQRLVRSAERVCYVTNTLRNPPNITVNVANSQSVAPPVTPCNTCATGHAELS